MGDSWRSRYAGLIYAVLSAFLIAGFFAFTNLFRYADGLVYDAMVRLTAGEQPADELLLIEAGAGHRDDGDKTWLTLLRELEKLGARKIAFTFVPQGVSAAFYDYARQQGNVVFGRRVIAAVGQTSQESIEPWPSQAGKELPFGVLTLPLAEYGVYRWHRSFVQIGGTRYPTLEQTAASRSDSVDRPTPPDRFLINFEVGSGRLPRLTLSRLLAGGAIPELVKNRVVLIGFASTSEIPGVKTPISPPGMTTSLLDVRGAALHTLLTGRFIHRPGLPALFGMLLVVTLVSLLVFHWLDSRRATVSASLAIFAAYVLTGLYLFKTVQLWLPIVALASAQLLFFVLFYREKAMLHDETMRAMLLELSEELKKRVTPASFYETREHWQQVANMLYQTLDLERLILLERVEGDHRLREVQALNCSLDDIEERRRDYERQPYKRAIEENGPVRLERQYLRNRGEGEEEYLVPLVFAGDVMGFWAFTVGPEQRAQIHDFSKVIRDFARQISELLYHRLRWQLQQRQEQSGIRDYLGVEGHSRVLREVRKDLALHEFRLSSLENVMNGMSVAAIVYDLFGDVLQVNRRMEDLAKQLDVEPYELTALDFMRELTGLSAARCRRMFREIVLEHGRFSLPVRAENSERVFLLTIQPLYHRESGHDVEAGAAHPFALQGILCELVDVTEMRAHYGIKDRLIERFLFQMRHDLQAVMAASSLLTHREIKDEQRARTETLIDRRVSHILSMFARMHRYIGKDLEAGTSEVYPVDPCSAVTEAVEALADVLQQHKVSVEVEKPPFANLVLAEPGGMLAWVIRVALVLLIDDAVEHSTIHVGIEHRGAQMFIRCRNRGFGLPDERMQAYLFGELPVDSKSYKDMREAILRIREWGGDVQAHAQVGEGMQIDLMLQVFFHD